MGDLDGLLDLGGGIGEDVYVGGSGGAHGIPRMGKETGRSPEELFSRFALEFLELVHDRIKGLVGFREGRELGSDVPVVEAIVVDPDLVQKLEEHVGPLDRVFHRIGPVVPWHEGGAGAERIGQWVSHAVPVGGAETQVILHLLALYLGIGVVMLEGQVVLGIFTLEGNLRDFGEVLSHDGLFFVDGVGV